jgi:hypothetical protein
MHGRVINGDAALCHHLFQVAEAEIVSEMLASAEEDYCSVRMSTLAHRIFRCRDTGYSGLTLKQTGCDGTFLLGSRSPLP